MRSWPPTGVPSLPGTATALRVHDTATDGLILVEPPDGTARLYVCGITPYDATHLGHAATYLAFDTLVRVWLDHGLDVQYVQNVTDIDDPLLERAARDGLHWIHVAERDTQLFRDDMTALRVLPPTWYVGAVEAIEEIAALVVRLQEAGATYSVDGDIYFSVAAAEHFGQVAGLDVATMTRLSAERGGDPDRPRQEGSAGLPALDAAATGRARLALGARHRSPRLARRVHRDGAEPPRQHHRRAGRRLGPGVPAPRAVGGRG